MAMVESGSPSGVSAAPSPIEKQATTVTLILSPRLTGRAQTISTSTSAARMADIRLETSPSTTMIKKINTGIEVWATVQTIAFWTLIETKIQKQTENQDDLDDTHRDPKDRCDQKRCCKGFGQHFCGPAKCITFDGCETGDCEGNYPAAEEKYLEVLLDLSEPERADQYHQEYSKQPDIDE